MIKEKKYNLYCLAGFLLGALAVFVYIDFVCPGNNCYTRELLVSPFFFTLLGSSASLLLLLFFDSKIFVSWLKYIAWWYLIFTVWVTSQRNNDLWYENSDYAMALMIILFIITLIYASVMTIISKKKSKN